MSTVHQPLSKKGSLVSTNASNASQPIASVAGQTVQADRVSPRSLWQTGLIAALVAAAINLVLWGLVRGPLGVSPDFPALQSAGAVIAASLVGILAATLVFTLLLRFAPRPVVAFRIIAGVALVLSLGGPVSTAAEPGASGTAVAILAVMHVVTAAVAAWLLPTAPRAGSNQTDLERLKTPRVP